MIGKKKIAIISLTSCEGCQFMLLDLGERFFDFLDKVDLVDCNLIEDKPFSKTKIDIAFVEGNPITKENMELLKKIRKQAKILVVLGNCAALGGIPEMKNYQSKEKTIRHIYRNLKNVENPEIKEVDNFVKVDFTIPGCPISGEEFLRAAEQLINGKIPAISQNPVCLECPLKGKPECFLSRKTICLGLITLAGCSAICPKNEFPCWGCRGLLKEAKIDGFLKMLEKFSSKEEVEEILEIFGLKDDVKNKIKIKI